MTQLYSFDQIRELVVLMQQDQGPLMAKMRDILMRYDGDWVIPMIDLDNEPKMPQLTPALVGEAIDQLALRASSVTPTITSPPMIFDKERNKGSRDFARRRAQIINATYERSRWGLGRRRYYRHLTAYHTASIVVIPDMEDKMPRIETRDPLSAFCEPQASESLRDPNYAAFITRYSGKHLRKCWPMLASEQGGPITMLETARLWEVVEWFDCEETVWGLVGPCDNYGAHINQGQSMYSTTGPFMEISRLPNRAGMPPVCLPHNVSLGRIASRIGALLGSIDLQAKLMALHVAAQEKSVFPDVYIIGHGNDAPELTSGAWKDGRSGDVNTIQNADSVGVVRQTPDPTTGQMVDRLERNFKTSVSLTPQQGGETYGALRTGRAINELAGMALDPRVQELHQITEAYLPSLNKAILATYKGYWGSKSYSMYCGYASARKLIEFVPSEHIETLENSVSYHFAGADEMQVTQILGSLYGAALISKRTVMEQHPMIADADVEMTQRREEELESAAITALQQQIASGQLPMTIAGMVAKKLRANMDVFDSIASIDEELRKLQATQAPPPGEGQVAPPETMPGLSGGPAADQQAPPQENVQVPGDAARMRQLMQVMGGS